MNHSNSYLRLSSWARCTALHPLTSAEEGGRQPQKVRPWETDPKNSGNIHVESLTQQGRSRVAVAMQDRTFLRIKSADFFCNFCNFCNFFCILFCKKPNWVFRCGRERWSASEQLGTLGMQPRQCTQQGVLGLTPVVRLILTKLKRGWVRLTLSRVYPERFPAFCFPN